MNMGKGVLVPPGKEAPSGGFWMEMPSQGRSYGLPIDSLGNKVGSSNWQEFVGDGAVYSQPLEVQNYNRSFHDFNVISQVGLPGIGSNLSGNRNGSMNQIGDMYVQPLNTDDAHWSGSWEQLLSLMKAPSAVHENGMANSSMRATNDHVLIPNSNPPGNRSAIAPPKKVPYAVQQNGTSSSMSAAAGHEMPSSYPRASNLMHVMMKASPMGIGNKNLDANGYITPDAYPQESSYQMQPNVASSIPLNQSYYIASNHRHSNNSLSHTMQPSSIRSSSQIAPLTPQPTKRSHQYSATMNLPLELNQERELQGDLVASSTTYSSQFAPATPHLAKRADNYQWQVTQRDQIQDQEKVQKEILGGTAEKESIQHDCQEIIHLDSPSAAIDRSLKERSDNEENQNIDLNKTPPKKAPRRKKHRPKVIVENKPPRNRKPIKAKSKTGPDGLPVLKRKYVRKTKCNAIKTPQPDVGEKTKDSIAEPASKSCRRSLNFELQDNIIDTTKPVDQQERHHQSQNIFHNVIAQDQEAGLHAGSNHSTGIKSVPQSGQWDVLIQGNKEAGSTSRLHPSIHQTQKEDSLQSNQYMLGFHPMMNGRQKEKPYISTSNEAKRATDLCNTTANGYPIPAHQPLYVGASQPHFQEITTREKRARQMFQMIAQNQQQRVLEYIQSRGSKRDYGLTKEHEGTGHSTNLISSQLCKEILQNEHNRINNRPVQCYSGTHKRKKTETLSTSSGIQYSARAAEKCSSESQINGYPTNHFLEMNGGLFNLCHQSNSSGKPKGDLWYSSSELNAGPASPCTNPLRQSISSEASLGQEKLAEKEEKTSALAHMITSLNAWAYPFMQYQTPSNEALFRTQSPMIRTTNGSNHVASVNMQNGAPIPPKRIANKTGSRVKQKRMVSVDDIIDQLECLNLNSTKIEMVKDEQKALVLYKSDGTIIPYEGFDLLKRRKPRAKVDLDPETDRLWKLLMRKEVSDDEKQTDEQKTKWWEEQRKIFRGRADSFIARMHLVQGDRRFSPWKGSVVDSVIGVFLTQNVTDHLSSSAFMSLAARFPPQSIRRNIASDNNKPNVLAEEPEICTIDTNDKIQKDEKFRQQANYNRILREPLDQHKQKLASVDGIQQSFKANWSLDEVISSQHLAKSSSIDMSRVVQSLFMSDSKADCPTNGSQSISRYSTMPFIIEEMENLNRLPNFTSQESRSSCYKTDTNGHVQLQKAETSKQKQLDGVNLDALTTVTYPFNLNRPQLQNTNISSSICQCPIGGGLGLYETDSFNMLRKKHHMSLHSASEDVDVTSEGIGKEVQGKILSIHNRKKWPAEPPTENPCMSQRKNKIDQKNSTQIAAQNYHHQRLSWNRQHDRTLSTQFRSESDKESLHSQIKMLEDATACNLPGHSHNVRKSTSAAESGLHLQNKSVESNLKEQDCSSTEASSRTKINVSKEKGGKLEGEKTTVDWDCLRRQVKSNANLKARNQDTMDSIDYEALLHADVGEISNAIKERGMNNMLADRMKDFLNRLVRDHGSIDLEWLRDAPPDKAKDYLLSIRGLGLKSVECIRLLTLHQHAFPVDTNVGRIAVRLGWVPLQPLPESLQLHLLELYPVLESIQKYLWPRLCNLDQRTLYELHYQLITFGKVFCTKSKPNCNACPMRGECRHFASAFASSRLALPGPEERSMVTSSIPIEISRNPTITVSPIPLYSLQDVPPEEATSTQRTCEPIVEEPTTPEPGSTEISETDIEDAYFEESDEIPIIRLNVEEFTQNLQNFMQENMELQEGDMSKALVSLNPKVASIPTPKLKNVSRLRTEHQVYQLPESHPLLKELEKREPDDPSPYLLAIWTPGETANSIRPPEGICSFQESGEFCSEKTCFTCNSIRESNSQTVRGTLLIPCRTAMRGSFPLNGTYFQVNEVFADHESSLNPIDVPRAWIWNLPRRTVYFGTSVTTIFKGMSTEDIQYCFWRGFVCVRGFDQKTRMPRPLMARLHFPASKQVKRQKRDQIRQTGTVLTTAAAAAAAAAHDFAV